MAKSEQAQRFILYINTFLMSVVILMVGFFAYAGATYMVLHSIPTIGLFIWFYSLIRNKRLVLYVWLLYWTMVAYLLAATICVGYSSGFLLYTFPLIAAVFYLDYLVYTLLNADTTSIRMSIWLAILCLLCAIRVYQKGPAYSIDAKAMTVCLAVNAAAVMVFLISYFRIVQNMVYESERRLSDLALLDRLTGLFNRHSMLEHMDKLMLSATPEYWVAMVDIDDFKSINDRYGHNCGDYVLVELTNAMRKICQGCIISRWGGEEFLIATDGISRYPGILELYRQTIERTPFSFAGIDFKVTVTIGIANYQQGQSLDKWIQTADDKLYDGKRGGKNRVVY